LYLYRTLAIQRRVYPLPTRLDHPPALTKFLRSVLVIHRLFCCEAPA